MKKIVIVSSFIIIVVLFYISFCTTLSGKYFANHNLGEEYIEFFDDNTYYHYFKNDTTEKHHHSKYKMGENGRVELDSFVCYSSPWESGDIGKIAYCLFGFDGNTIIREPDFPDYNFTKK
jgi:hypothetical protein